MTFKMIVTDLDGTLLNDEKKISDKDIKMLNKLSNSGIEIVVATGRNYFMAKNLTEQIKNLNPVILANNGAVARRSDTDEKMESNYLNSDIFDEIYNRGLKYNLHPVLHVDEYENGYDMIYENEDLEKVYLGYIRKDDARSKRIKFHPREIKNILSVCYLEEIDKLRNFDREMNQFNMGKFNSICNRNISKRALLEFLHIDGCKWRALKKYADSLNIKPDEIISFGDDNNDLELIVNSGMGISMINGTDNCKNAARKISEFDNNNSGVSYELSKIFNIK
nr:Cof-type HAD-IIB family hydrolase [Sedimentibacter sp.]